MEEICLFFSLLLRKNLTRFEGRGWVQILTKGLKSGSKVVVNCSGRGDKDVHTAARYLQELQEPPQKP